ncbi:hypothetical protein GCM10010507_42640 [Streptomyces cinnamoneus]|uniref:Uncharacterized protein n=1 Tax=Streptomyces cinnamoneus TaxID=53446 RepID=A0A918WMZ6_STRCJ|nr:hypothetical protein GCM10010507_42640 [Streptomyces cinnamoneus]
MRKTGGVVRARFGKEVWWAPLPGVEEWWGAVRADGGRHPVHPAWSHAETGRRES